MNSPTARLKLLEHSTELVFGNAEPVSLPVGALGLTENVLRHEPPTPVELERGIDLLEDALGASRLAHEERGPLLVADALLRRLPGLEAQGADLSREDVEALFQKLASRALGTPVAHAQLPPEREVAAALLILRECMHHLGFERVVVTAD